MARKATELKLKRVSEDLYVYNHEEFDDLQLEPLYENFTPAPPISVAEYRARTSEILPRGIFDDTDVPGILFSKNIPYSCDVREKDISGPKPQDIIEDVKSVGSETHVPDVRASNKAPNGKISVVEVPNPIEINGFDKSGNQKKKKKKFKKLDLDDLKTKSTLIYSVPFQPNLPVKEGNGKHFPPL